MVPSSPDGKDRRGFGRAGEWIGGAEADGRRVSKTAGCRQLWCTSIYTVHGSRTASQRRGDSEVPLYNGQNDGLYRQFEWRSQVRAYRIPATEAYYGTVYVLVHTAMA